MKFFLPCNSKRSSQREDIPMPYSISRVAYFTTTVRDQPGEAHHTLQLLAEHGINLLAFTATPSNR